MVRGLRFFFHFNDLFNVLSRPVPSITLKKTGTHVTLGTTTGNVNRLVIDSFALHDAGEYMCMASDDSGASNIKSTVITMEGKYLLSCVALRESTYTAISRKVVGKNVHTTIPKGDMGYDRYTVPDDCSCRTYF